MIRPIPSIVPALSLSIGLLACHPKDDGSDFSAGVPRASTVAMAVPSSDSKALTVESGSYALLGETAEWYRTTRNVSIVVNAGALAVGTLVKLVTDFPPTSVTSDQAVWGPWHGPLDPIEWKVTVTRIALHQYQYKFEGRDKHDQTAAYVTVLSGAHTAGLDAQGLEMEGFGSGAFVLDWNARAALPTPSDKNVGTATYTYDHVGPDAVVRIAAQLKQVKDSGQPSKLVDVNYSFIQNPGADGSMDFTYSVPADATSPGGISRVRSRWLSSGAGRSDVSLVSTDLAATYTTNECWDTSYLSVYKAASYSTIGAANWGNESDCAFKTAQYSDL